MLPLSLIVDTLMVWKFYVASFPVIEFMNWGSILHADNTPSAFYGWGVKQHRHTLSLSEGKTWINVYRLILWLSVLWKMLNMLHQALFWIKMWKEKYVSDQDHYKIGYKGSRKHLWTIWINISVVWSLFKPLLSTLNLNNLFYLSLWWTLYFFICNWS